MLLKKILAGKYFLRSIIIQPVENSSQLFKITICRKRAINLNDNPKMYVNNTYVRYNIANLNRLLNRKSKSHYMMIWSRENWILTYYFDEVNMRVYKFLNNSFYGLYVFYLILLYLNNWVNK